MGAQSSVLAPNIPIYTDNKFSMLELAFITAYVSNGFNATQAVIDAGYKNKNPGMYAGALLARDKIRAEISARIEAVESAKIAKPAEILQFYTSVMRGELLDQFGIEASLDTRIKAANELAKHQIEMPMKLEQKNITNNIGSITLNFIPRPSEDFVQIDEEVSPLV
jgi:phage terminase small subunit